MKAIKNYYYRFGRSIQLISGFSFAIAFAFAILANVFIVPFANAQQYLPVPVGATGQGGDASIPTIQNITGGSSFVQTILCPVINAFFWILIGISVLYVLWAAFLYVTAQDDSEKVSRATKTILYAAIGIAVALISQTVPGLVGSLFGVGYIGGCSVFSVF